MKRKLIDLASQRTQFLQEAENALQAGNNAAYDDAMAKVSNVNADIERVQNLVHEQERQLDMREPSAAEFRDMAEDRVNELIHGREVKLSIDEMRRAFRNTDGDGTLMSGAIAQPTGAGANINDNIGACSLLDLVRVENFEGLSGWEEPYMVSDMATDVGTPSAKAGTARTASDPTFGVSCIKPYEASTTSFIDRNAKNLSPAAYYSKIQRSALRALRNKTCGLILCGDNEVNHVMYGMINGTNKAGASIIDTIEATVANGAGKVDVNLLEDLYFSYGDDLTVGGNGMVFLNKKDLKALGKLRGTNEKGKLYGITPMPGDACRGTISDGGMIIPYLVNGALAAIEGTEQAASSGADKLCCAYGDPINYLLGLFSDYTIRIDPSVKAIERMDTILGDVLLGGNVVAHKGFIAAKISKAAAVGG